MSNRFGRPRGYSPRPFRTDLSAGAVVYARLAQDFAEQIDEALDAFNQGLITRAQYRVLRDRLREAKATAEEKMEIERRRGVAQEQFRERFGARRGRRF